MFTTSNELAGEQLVNRGNTVSQKERNNSPETKFKISETLPSNWQTVQNSHYEEIQ